MSARLLARLLSSMVGSKIFSSCLANQVKYKNTGTKRDLRFRFRKLAPSFFSREKEILE